MKTPKHPNGIQLTLLVLAASLLLWATWQSVSSSSDTKQNVANVVHISLLNASAHFLTGMMLRVLRGGTNTTMTASPSED